VGHQIASGYYLANRKKPRIMGSWCIEPGATTAAQGGLTLSSRVEHAAITRLITSVA
jgi:hypothetical protein